MGTFLIETTFRKLNLNDFLHLPSIVLVGFNDSGNKINYAGSHARINNALLSGAKTNKNYPISFHLKIIYGVTKIFILNLKIKSKKHHTLNIVEKR